MVYLPLVELIRMVRDAVKIVENKVFLHLLTDL